MESEQAGWVIVESEQAGWVTVESEQVARNRVQAAAR